MAYFFGLSVSPFLSTLQGIPPFLHSAHTLKKDLNFFSPFIPIKVFS